MSYKRTAMGAFDTTGCARVAPSADGLTVECIDASGNVLRSGPPTKPGMFGLSTTTLLVIGGAAAYFLFLRKR